jgi:hypothetical protein
LERLNARTAGVSGLGPPDFEERVLREHLVAMNEGRAAIYRASRRARIGDRVIAVVLDAERLSLSSRR